MANEWHSLELGANQGMSLHSADHVVSHSVKSTGERCAALTIRPSGFSPISARSAQAPNRSCRLAIRALPQLIGNRAQAAAPAPPKKCAAIGTTAALALKLRCQRRRFRPDHAGADMGGPLGSAHVRAAHSILPRSGRSVRSRR